MCPLYAPKRVVVKTKGVGAVMRPFFTPRVVLAPTAKPEAAPKPPEIMRQLFTRVTTVKPVQTVAPSREVTAPAGESIADAVKDIGQGQATAAAKAIASTDRMRKYVLLAKANPDEAATYQDMIDSEARNQARMVVRQRQYVIARMSKWAKADIRQRVNDARAGKKPLPPGLAQAAMNMGLKQNKPQGFYDFEPERTIISSWPD